MALVEAKKAYSTGFILNEAEVRRLVDDCRKCFAKLTPPHERFWVKFDNGAIAEYLEVDEVLALENHGTSRIVWLTLLFSTAEPKASGQLDDDEGLAKLESQAHAIRVRFKDAFKDESISARSIAYAVRSPDRDWAFVTSSVLDERIRKISTRGTWLLKPSRNLAFFLSIIFMGTMATIALNSSLARTSDGIALLRTEWEAGRLKDPVEAVIRAREIAEPQPLSVWMLLMILAALVPTFLPIVLRPLFPLYNFMWGAYADFYAGRSRLRRWIFGIVIGGIILSVVGGLLTNVVWDGVHSK